jgi:hypothetical protein
LRRTRSNIHGEMMHLQAQWFREEFFPVPLSETGFVYAS